MSPETALEVANERLRQLEKWGVQNHTHVEWLAIAVEELGEAAREAVRLALNPPKGEVGDAKALRKEVVETTAVLVAWLDEGLWERLPEGLSDA